MLYTVIDNADGSVLTKVETSNELNDFCDNFFDSSDNAEVEISAYNEIGIYFNLNHHPAVGWHFEIDEPDFI